MGLPYAYAVGESVLHIFARSRVREREELLRILEALANNPFQPGDYRQKSAEARDLQVKRFGKWLITYWPDHPSSEVRVVAVQKLVP